MTVKMETGSLTPPSNETLVHRRYVSANFAQPDGFGGVLKLRINKAGRVELCVESRNLIHTDQIERVSIALDNEQRQDLIEALSQPKIVKMENI